MKLSTIHAAILLLQHTSAWVQRALPTSTTTTIRHSKDPSTTVLFSLAAPKADSSNQTHGDDDKETNSQHKSIVNNSIQAELSSGKLMEGGEVIDFSSVKASSHAEQALSQARFELLSKNPNILQQQQTDKPQILGINQDVIAEVGHPLGQFATWQEIQDCAAYLRSQAPPSLKFHDSSATATSTPYNTRYQEILQQAYTEAGEVTGAYAKTFYMGTMLLGEAARKAIWAVYVWCRRTDEIVDAPRDNEDDMLRDLSLWEMRLEALWNSGQVVDVYDLVLLDCLIKYPTLDITPFLDMIRGMLMDVPALGQDRYESFDELHLYCYRVAGTVGLMSLPVFGCAPGYDDIKAREPALSLGVAFQITNILRDVGEDAVQRGRVYLPQEDLREFGVTEDQIFAQQVDENYINLMKFEIARARKYYERARRGVFMLAPESRLPVQSSLDAYGRILDKIEENGYDSLTKRAYVDKWEKLSIIPFSWYRTQDISKTLPLPGDKTIEALDYA